MLMKSQNRRILFSFALVVGILIPNLLLQANSEKSSVYRYQNATGESYYAVGLNVSGDRSQTKTDKTFIIFDTSASQVGAHRDEALSILTNVLKQMPANHLVQIAVLDVELTEFQKSFSNVQSDSVKEALNKIQNRAPLGTTNLFKGLKQTASILKNESNISILYIGDGMSIGHIFRKEDVSSLAKQFRNQKLTVHSYVVGPKVDLELPGIIAQQTGGTVRHSSSNDQSTAKYIAQSVSVAPVYFSKFNNSLSIKPSSPLPLRADRNTYFLVKGNIPETISASGNNKEVKWKLASSKIHKGNASLMHSWNRAVRMDDMSLSLAGDDLLKLRLENFDHQVSQLVEAGEYALKVKQYKQAEHIGKRLNQFDPTNTNIKFLLISSQNGAKSAPQAKQNNKIPRESRLEAELRLRKIREEKIARETEKIISYATRIAPNEPEQALSELKTAIVTMSSTTDITPEIQKKLFKRLLNARQSIINQTEINQQKLQRFHEQVSQIEARRSIRQRVRDNEEETEQLVDRVRALIIEAYHGNDEAFEEAEAVARELVDLNPGSGPSIQTLFVSEAAGQLMKSFRLRALRNDRFLETLHQVELSHVPFPDEPPVRWPSPEFWDYITKTRKKWKDFDIYGSSKTENRIREILDETIDLDFLDSSLVEVIDYIKDLKQIPIKIAFDKLEDDGTVDPEEGTITFTQSGIKLKSALNQILGDTNLTYIIDNEILTITTTAAAAENPPPPRIYYVGYFNRIIQQQAGGQQGGQQGQQGNQQNNAGGGGGGFGGGGGGGGFSVPGNFMLKAKKAENNRPNKNSLKNFLRNKTSYLDATPGQAFAQIQVTKFHFEGDSTDNFKKKQISDLLAS
jgi:tetratricopeptide (TPR) repeat protein